MNNRIVFIYCILTGVLLGLAFPPIPLFPLAFFGFLPLLFALEHNNSGKVFFKLYSTFFVYNLITIWWIGSWQSDSDPFLMASGIAVAFFHPLFFLIPMYIYLYIKKKIGFNNALWLFPFIWTAYEWFHSLGEFSYPWLNIGYTQAYNYYFVQIADIAGVWGVSFLVLFINVFVIRIFMYYISKGNENLVLKSPKRLYPNFIVIGLILLLSYGYGYIKIFDEEFKITPNTTSIGIIQPNINPWDKWSKSVYHQIRYHLKLQDSLLAQGINPDMFLWSETAIPYYDMRMNHDHDFAFVQDWVDKNNIPILTGFADYHLYKKGEEISATAKKFTGSDIYYSSANAAVMITPEKEKADDIYRKMKLTPFSERIPYVEYIPFLKDFVQWGVGISSWELGKEQKNLTLYRDNSFQEVVKVAPIICIESIYPKFVSQFSELGADFFVIITNDAWYDYTFGPEQHFIIAQMRAIENRRYIARCANSGVSGFISTTGKRYSMLSQYKSIASAGIVELRNNKTLYVKYGDYLPVISSIITIIFLLFAMISKRNK